MCTRGFPSIYGRQAIAVAIGQVVGQRQIVEFTLRPRGELRPRAETQRVVGPNADWIKALPTVSYARSGVALRPQFPSEGFVSAG